MEPLKFDQILYNEPIYWLEQQWGRELTPHEKNIVILTYRFTRTSQEAEEIKILEHLAPKELNCCICGDDPSRKSFKGELFCGSCFKEIYS